MTALGSSSQSVTDYVVRVPKNTTKKYNLMGFNAADKINFATWTQARMERDLSNKKIYQEEEMPESGAGSEFNRKQRDEAWRKKYGIVHKEFKLEDQPWLLRVNGKAGRRFKGIKKGGVTENASYYIFTQCPDGAFEAFPVHNWYTFTPIAKHRTLTAEEAEEEWERRNKVLNHFTIMQQRRLRDHGDDDEDEEEKEKGKKKKKKKKTSDLKIHDLEDDLELSTTESESGSGGEEKPPKPKKKAAPGKKKKKKGSDDEALEESDDGDFEGQEVDYMSDQSSSSEDEGPGKPKQKKEEGVPQGIDEGNQSEEESEEEKPAGEEEKEEEEEEEKKAPTPQEKKKKKDSSDESETSEESDIDGEASSALLIQKKKTPPKKEKRGSASSSKASSRPGTPTVDASSTSSTLRAAASKLEQGKRQGASGNLPAAKRLKMEGGTKTSGKSTPQPQSGKSTPSSGGPFSSATFFNSGWTYVIKILVLGRGERTRMEEPARVFALMIENPATNLKDPLNHFSFTKKPPPVHLFGTCAFWRAIESVFVNV